MAKFLISILRLYVAVIFTIIASNYLLAYVRTTQFERMEACCSTAAEQYQVFSALKNTITQIDGNDPSLETSRLERYRGVNAWNIALVSAARTDESGNWGRSGQIAVGRIVSFLAERRITAEDVNNLTILYRTAGPDVDPVLAESQVQMSAYLLQNLTYLGAVTGVAQDERRGRLTMEAGGPDKLNAFVRQHNRKLSGMDMSPSCSSFEGAREATSLGRTVEVSRKIGGLLNCLSLTWATRG